MELTLAIVGSILISLLANELYDRGPTVARTLIRRAAKRLPARIRERYEEEWLAHLDECGGKISKFLHGTECFLCVRSLRKMSRYPAAVPPDISLDYHTAKFFFALGALDRNERGERFLRLWEQLSGEDKLPRTKDEVKSLRKAADDDQLEQLFQVIESRLNSSDDMTVALKRRKARPSALHE